jgi:hypothetical protein
VYQIRVIWKYLWHSVLNRKYKFSALFKSRILCYRLVDFKIIFHQISFVRLKIRFGQYDLPVSFSLFHKDCSQLQMIWFYCSLTLLLWGNFYCHLYVSVKKIIKLTETFLNVIKFIGEILNKSKINLVKIKINGQKVLDKLLARNDS